jgi:hypothetical protein
MDGKPDTGRSPEPEAGFSQSRTCFVETVEWLAGPEAAALTHAELDLGSTDVLID